VVRSAAVSTSALTIAAARMKAPARVETERLVLRRPRPDDATGIFERYASDADVVRYLSWPRHTSINDTYAFLTFSDAEWDRWPAGPYVAFRREDDLLVGGTGLAFDAPCRAMTGYVLARDAWGQGYATEMLRAMVELARACRVADLYAFCHETHRASSHVLEKVGFVRDALHQTDFPNLAPHESRASIKYVLSLQIPQQHGTAA
jgi:RimJ/RimL family protein N-acetyltransferase